MSFEVTGKLLVKYDTQSVNDRFRKREFVLELEDNVNGNIYTNYAKMQLVQNKCDILDRFKEGDLVKVSFNIKGNRWERDGKVNFITNLDAWRVEPGVAGGDQQGGYNNQAAAGYNNSGYSNSNSGYNNNFGNNNAGGNNVSFNGGNNYNPAPENADDLPF